jgi:hypothetical protein
MQAEVHGVDDVLESDFAALADSTDDGSEARAAFRGAFGRLRTKVTMHPPDLPRPSTVFQSGVTTARRLAVRCLPLAVAVTMHLYPLCALQCVPLPLLSPARFKRAMLLRTIRHRSLIVANAGSERTHGSEQTLIATAAADGIRLNGQYEYMSLSSVADIVLCKAKLASGAGVALCAADLKGDSVRVGPWKFAGRMRLSDTSSITFSHHLVPQGRYMLVPEDAGLECSLQYQRCWFHLFIAEVYLARREHLREIWQLPRTHQHVVTLNEVSHLRLYSLTLLDDYAAGGDLVPLTKATAALKLRVSLLAQATADELRNLDGASDARALAADASELCYIKSHPTADDKIVQDLGLSRV